MATLDVFKADAFNCMSLTDAVNKIPFVPGMAGQVINWSESGVNTTVIAIEEVDGTLELINPTGRGGPGSSIAKNKRKVRNLAVPHYQIDDAIYAEEIQNIRAFGSETELETIQAKVNARIAEHVQLKHDPTLEYQRVGAVKGVILNGDGTTLYDLFSEFGVSQEAEVNFDLTDATPESGEVRNSCSAVIRLIGNNLGGTPFQGVVGFAGDTFYDQLIAHPEVRETYLNQQEASQLRGLAAWQYVDYGGIRFYNYRGAVGGTPFITATKCHFAAVGVPGLFRTVYAPADYVETVNTMGVPRYAKQYLMPNEKGVNLETQMNALSYCTRPKSLIVARNA